MPRIEAIAGVLQDLDRLSTQERQRLYVQARSIIEHNYHHFYSGAFEAILWTELNTMLAEL